MLHDSTHEGAASAFMVEKLESRTLLSAGVLHAPPELAVPQAALTVRQDPQTPRSMWQEIRYMSRMGDQYQAIVSLAQLTVAKAERPELRALAEELVETYTAAIEQLTTWSNEWYGVALAPELTRGQERQLETLMTIPAERFDAIVPRMLIRYHRAALGLSRPMTRLAVPEDLRDWAVSAVETHTSAITEMQDAMRDWYGPGTVGSGGRDMKDLFSRHGRPVR